MKYTREQLRSFARAALAEFGKGASARNRVVIAIYQFKAATGMDDVAAWEYLRRMAA